ncbi:preprotein translocase subunit YajC [Chloroflexota bacterium]
MDKVKKLHLALTAALSLSLLSLVGCVAPEGGQEGGLDWRTIIFLVFIAAIFYFFLMRPQRRRQKEHQKLTMELKRGDKVITAGGIYGTIENLSEESAVLKIESGATIRVARGSVVRRLDA